MTTKIMNFDDVYDLTRATKVKLTEEFPLVLETSAAHTVENTTKELNFYVKNNAWQEQKDLQTKLVLPEATAKTISISSSGHSFFNVLHEENKAKAEKAQKQPTKDTTPTPKPGS